MDELLNIVYDYQRDMQKEKNVRELKNHEYDKIVRRFETIKFEEKERLNRKMIFIDNEIIFELMMFGPKGKPVFRACDCASFLGYTNTRKAIRDHVWGKYKFILEEERFVPPNNNESKTIFINEHGLYQLILRSKLSIAEKFQEWVYEKVLPSIRQTGKYEHNFKMDSNIIFPEHEGKYNN